MKKSWVVWIGAAVVSLAAVAEEQPQAELSGKDVRVKHLRPFAEAAGEPWHGYWFDLVSVTNGSKEQSRRIDLSWGGSSSHFRFSPVNSRMTADIPPGTERRLFVPHISTGVPVGIYGKKQGYAVSVDGVPFDKPLASVGSFEKYYGRYYGKTVLLSPSISANAVQLRLESLPEGKGDKRGEEQERVTYLTGLPDWTAWSGEWLAYSSFDAVVVAAQDWQAMPEAVRTALARYVTAGGGLFLAGAAVPGMPRLGKRGLGEIGSFSSAEPETWTDKEEFSLLDRCIQRGQDVWFALKGNAAKRETRKAFRPILPVSAVYWILLGITVLCGPVLLLALARRNERIHLYWIAPAAAVAVSVCIVVWALAAGGVRPKVETQSVVLLDAGADAAVSLTEMTVAAPFSVSGGFVFMSDTEVSARVADQPAGGATAVTFNDAQCFSSLWLKPYTPLTFFLRRADPRGGRGVTFDGVRARDGLGKPVSALLYRADDGKLYLWQGVPTEGEVTLLPIAERKGKAEPLPAILSKCLKGDTPFSTLMDTVVLPPGTYIARIDGAPFIEAVVGGSAVRHEVTLVLGTAGGGRQ